MTISIQNGNHYRPRHSPFECRYWASVLAATAASILFCSGCSRTATLQSDLARADRYYDSGQYDSANIEYKNVLQLDPFNTRANIRLAQIYIQEGRLHSAIPLLQRMRRLQPDNPELQIQIALIDLDSGHLSEARKEAASVLLQRPIDPDGLSVLAQTAQNQNEFKETRERLEKLLDSTRAAAPAWVALGTLYLRQHNLKDAESAFRQALVSDPTSSSAYLALGTLLWVNKDLVNADQAFAAAFKLAPSRSTTRLRYVQFKLRTGDTGAAVSLLEGMINQTPDYLPASILLAEINADQKKFDESASTIAKVLSRDPSNPEGLLLRARLDLARGEDATAIKELERMQSIYPRSAPVSFRLGQAYLANRDLKNALGTLNRAITLDPDFSDAILLLAETYIQNGDPGSARSLLEPFSQKHPEIPQASLLLASADRSLGYLVEALGIYRLMGRAFPRNPETPVLAGLILAQQGKLDEARRSFNKALDLSPNYLPAVEQLINIDLSEKHFQAALQRASAEAAKEPNLAEPRLLVAEVFLAQNDMNSAETELLRAIDLKPDFQIAYLFLARIYIATNRQQKALSDLQKTVSDNPKNVRALMMLGNLYDGQKNYPAAKDAYEKILLVDPNFSGALNNLAYLYSDIFDEQDKAFELAQKARELLPNEPHTMDTVGWILYKKHQFSWAVSLLQESAAKLPSEAEAQFHLGLAQYMMGREGEARDSLQRAINLDSEFPGNIEAKERLSLLAINNDTATEAAREMATRALAAFPNDPVALARLASLDARDGEQGKAIAGYQAALNASPAYVEATLELAKIYGAENEQQKALLLLKNSRQLNPSDPRIAHALGILAFETGNYTWAASLLQETFLSRPDDPYVLYDLARATYSLGRIADAVSLMQKALVAGISTPQDAEAKRFLDMIALSGSHRGGATDREQVERILEKEPAYVPALMALGSLETVAGDSAAGIKTYEKVLGEYPDFSPAMRQLIILDSENSADDSTAAEFATKAVEAYPDDPPLEKASGIVAFKSGEFSRAADLLQLGMRQLGDDPELVYYLGMAQYRLSMKIESKESLQRALSLNLDPHLAVEARRILTELN